MPVRLNQKLVSLKLTKTATPKVGSCKKEAPLYNPAYYHNPEFLKGPSKHTFFNHLSKSQIFGPEALKLSRKLWSPPPTVGPYGIMPKYDYVRVLWVTTPCTLSPEP